MPIAGARAQDTIAAPPEVVWRIVSDIARVSEWSPQCYRSEWIGGSTQPAVGARFKGYNRRGIFRWSRECRVSECEPGRVFAYSTYTGDREETRWRYEIEPADGGTLVTESFTNIGAPLYVKIINALATKRFDADREANLRASLARIKAIAEAHGI